MGQSDSLNQCSLPLHKLHVHLHSYCLYYRPTLEKTILYKQTLHDCALHLLDLLDLNRSSSCYSFGSLQLEIHVKLTSERLRARPCPGLRHLHLHPLEGDSLTLFALDQKEISINPMVMILYSFHFYNRIGSNDL